MLKVNGYALNWSVSNNKGTVYLHTTDGNQGQIPVDSPQELAALADILRNSSDVAFNPNGQVLITKVVPPGTS